VKIGLVFDDSLDRPDGVAQYVLTLGHWLSAQGHEVHYLVGQTTRTDLPNLHSLARNWQVRFNGNRLSIPLPANPRRLRALLRRVEFDVIHVQTPYSPLLAGKIVSLVGPKTAVIGSFHVLPYNLAVRWANHLLAILTRRTDRRFDHMFANSVPAKAFADQIYGFVSEVLPNPFPLADFQVSGTKKTIPTIVFLGRLVERKGARQLLEAVAYIRRYKLYEGLFRVIIGGKGEQLAKLQAYVTAQGLDELVSFSGFVAEADKAAFLAMADIAAFPSISGESFGISLLEAMEAARGVVLGGDNPGYRSVIEPLNEAQLVHPNEVASFAGQLVEWLKDEAGRSDAGKAQKQYVRQFDITIVGQQIVETYNEALRQRRNVR
jgi:phosphatidylinositol alpha-mannosyltransferase